MVEPMRTRIVAISCIRNEADIVEAFVRWNLRHVDALLIADHRSIDGSACILDRLVQEGLPIEVHRETCLAQDQWRIMTDLLHEAATRWAPDWVIPLDADEFLMPQNPPKLAALLDRLGQDTVRALGHRTYVPTSADDISEPHVLRRIRQYRDSDPGGWCKAIIPRPFLRNDVVIAQGNHGIYDGAGGTSRRGKEVIGMRLAHYPIRSATQAANKALAGWLGHLLRTDRKPGEAFHWERMFRRCSEGTALSADEIQALALQYVWTNTGNGPKALSCCPLEATGETCDLRYADLASPLAPVSVLREFAQRLGINHRKKPRSHTAEEIADLSQRLERAVASANRA